jgi:hypothetical protein
VLKKAAPKRVSVNKDKEEIKRLHGIIAEKDAEIEKLRAIVEKQAQEQAPEQPQMDQNKFNKIYKLFDSV